MKRLLSLFASLGILLYPLSQSFAAPPEKLPIESELEIRQHQTNSIYYLIVGLFNEKTEGFLQKGIPYSVQFDGELGKFVQEQVNIYAPEALYQPHNQKFTLTVNAVDERGNFHFFGLQEFRLVFENESWTLPRSITHEFKMESSIDKFGSFEYFFQFAATVHLKVVDPLSNEVIYDRDAFQMENGVPATDEFLIAPGGNWIRFPSRFLGKGFKGVITFKNFSQRYYRYDLKTGNKLPDADIGMVIKDGNPVLNIEGGAYTRVTIECSTNLTTWTILPGGNNVLIPASGVLQIAPPAGDSMNFRFKQ